MFNEDDLIVAQTDSIVISACPVLINEEEVEHDDQCLWGYYFCIENNSAQKIHLLGKNWNITDDKGNSFCDDSMGFKGEIPELEPGEYFEFTSTTPVNTADAVFYGSCKILTEGQKLARDIKIPTFSLNANKKSQISKILN